MGILVALRSFRSLRCLDLSHFFNFFWIGHDEGIDAQQREKRVPMTSKAKDNSTDGP
jgi:hypothetical protein